MINLLKPKKISLLTFLSTYLMFSYVGACVNETHTPPILAENLVSDERVCCPTALSLVSLPMLGHVAHIHIPSASEIGQQQKEIWDKATFPQYKTKNKPKPKPQGKKGK